MLLRNLLLVFVAICPLMNTYGQNQKLDSLTNAYNSGRHDTTRIHLLLEMGNAMESENPDTAMFYFNHALNLSIKNIDTFQKEEKNSLRTKYVNFQATSLLCIGRIQQNTGIYDKAYENIRKSLKLFENLGDESKIAECNRNIGVIYYVQGTYDLAIDCYNKSLNIFESIGNKSGMASCNNNIGLVYFDLGIYDKAIYYFLKSLKIYEFLSNKKGIETCYSNIGNVHLYQKTFDKAMEYFIKSLKIAEELNDKNAIAICYNNIGNVYYDMADFDKSIEFYIKSLKIHEEIGNKRGMSQCFNNMGNVYHDKGSYDDALSYYTKSLNIDEEIGDKNGIALLYGNISELHNILADSLIKTKGVSWSDHQHELAVTFGIKSYLLSKEIGALQLINFAANSTMYAFKKLGNYKKAMEYAEIFIITQDSLFKDEKTKSIADAEAKFKSEKKQLEIDKLSKEKELQRSELFRQKLVIIFVIAGIILVAVFAAFIVQRLRITRRQKEEISLQRDEIDLQHTVVSEQKNRIEKQKQQITNSINYAKRIQNAVLPSGEYAKSILGDHFILFQPKDIVSGDFYWATQIKEKLIIAVADCTGHGVPGAFMSMLGVSFLNEIVRKKEVIIASEVLDLLRNSIIEALQQNSANSEQKDGMDIAICVLNTNTNELQYAGAYNPIYIVTAHKELKIFNPDKQPVGIFENMKSFTNHECTLDKGDCLYMFSDGYVDQFGGQHDKKFMTWQLKDILVSIADKTMERQKEMLIKAFENWKGKKDQIDDVTILGLRI